MILRTSGKFGKFNAEPPFAPNDVFTDLMSRETAKKMGFNSLHVPTSARQAANAVRSIAATLCALDGVTAVQLSVIGETGLTHYDISQPIAPQADWYAE